MTTNELYSLAQRICMTKLNIEQFPNEKNRTLVKNLVKRLDKLLTLYPQEREEIAGILRKYGILLP